VLFIPVEGVDAVGGAVCRKTLIAGENAVRLTITIFAHPLVERGEEQVLQDGLIVGAGVGREVGEDALQLRLDEEFLGDKPLFLQEPTEDETCEEADKRGGAAFVAVFLSIGWELNLRECPEIPVGQLTVKTLVKQLDVENLLPRSVEGVEVIDRQPLRVDEVGDGEGGEDVEVTAMGLRERDITDDGDLAKDVAGGVTLVLTTVDNSDRKNGLLVSEVLYEHHDGHGEDAVDLACNSCEFAPWIVATGQLYGEKEIGAEQAGIDRVVLEEARLAGELLVCELEE